MTRNGTGAQVNAHKKFARQRKSWYGGSPICAADAADLVPDSVLEHALLVRMTFGSPHLKTVREALRSIVVIKVTLNVV